jgi:hypothetical protein
MGVLLELKDYLNTVNFNTIVCARVSVSELHTHLGTLKAGVSTAVVVMGLEVRFFGSYSCLAPLYPTVVREGRSLPFR